VKQQQHTKPTGTPTEPQAQAGQLNQTLSRAARTTAREFKKWRMQILSTLAAAFLAWAGYTAYEALQSQRDESLSATVYELFDSPAAEEDGYQLDEEKVTALLAEVEGKSAEKFVYKTIVEHYLKTATEISRESEQTSAPGEGNTEAALKTAVARVLTLSEKAAQQFPDDMDVQAWAKNARSKIKGQQDESWLPGGWKFTPPLPQPAAGDPVSGELKAKP